VAGGSGGYGLWNLKTYSAQFVPSHAVKYYYGCVYDPRGRCIYVADSIGKFRLLSADGKPARPVPGSPHQRHVVAFDLTPNGTRLVMSRGGGTMNRVECWKVQASGGFSSQWSICDGKPINPDEPYLIHQAKWFTHGVAIRTDAKIVATAEDRTGGAPRVHRRIIVRDGKSGKEIAELGETAGSFYTRLLMAVDGRATYAWDNELLERWDLKSGKCTAHIRAPGRAHFQGIAAHPSGRFLLTVSGDGTARSWDATELSLENATRCGVGKLHSVAVSPDGGLVAAGGDRGQIALWDIGG
jgi:WD40 repeat protein